MVPENYFGTPVDENLIPENFYGSSVDPIASKTRSMLSKDSTTKRASRFSKSNRSNSMKRAENRMIRKSLVDQPAEAPKVGNLKKLFYI